MKEKFPSINTSIGPPSSFCPSHPRCLDTVCFPGAMSVAMKQNTTEINAMKESSPKIEEMIKEKLEKLEKKLEEKFENKFEEKHNELAPKDLMMTVAIVGLCVQHFPRLPSFPGRSYLLCA